MSQINTHQSDIRIMTRLDLYKLYKEKQKLHFYHSILRHLLEKPNFWMSVSKRLQTFFNYVRYHDLFQNYELLNEAMRFL